MLVLPMYISKKYLKKLGKHLWRGLFCESYGLKQQQKSITINFTKVLFTAWTYKKARTAITKENLCFKQLQFNYINSQKKQTEITFLD